MGPSWDQQEPTEPTEGIIINQPGVNKAQGPKEGIFGKQGASRCQTWIQQGSDTGSAGG